MADPFDPASNPELVARPPGLPATEAEEQQSTLFEQALRGGAEKLRRERPRPPPVDPEEPEDIPVVDSLRAGLETSGIMVAGIRMGLEGDLPDLPEIPSETIEVMQTVRPQLFKALEAGLNDPDSLGGAPRLQILQSFTSYADADRQRRPNVGHRRATAIRCHKRRATRGRKRRYRQEDHDDVGSAFAENVSHQNDGIQITLVRQRDKPCTVRAGHDERRQSTTIKDRQGSAHQSTPVNIAGIAVVHTEIDSHGTGLGEKSEDISRRHGHHNQWQPSDGRAGCF